ncbi:cleavage and polyadenylation specificity factor subunit A [Aspergillus costaricaensis CBS 115574]|uniref:Cleavage and polyadenylation specificity factor subunit A n=1 Tax=Aspergillus costaricaensis CBS 115574 TaxID=1448317 RepID=A0ACD1IMK3_9EURO|nr:cleavage and polyadenylation specificity factor subunit A [Aspergillus costaricaensis CBS 115574]RAK91343.1 cleavage and polyadenylation specificity factor subunit A [Aspergillus costaricaensis CBS 115574]
MMQCYTELLPPTGVTHALAVPFLAATSNDLIVVRTSLLQIYSLHKVTSHAEGADAQQELTKLLLEKEYSLSGTVTGLCRVKVLNSRSGGEAVLVAFRNAKLSLIEWDPERRSISTISIHYYERDDLTRSPWVPDLKNCGSILSVDPSSRCAIFNFGIRNLAIIPFHQPGDDLVMDDYGSDLGEGMSTDHDLGGGTDKAKEGIAYQTPYAPSFVLPLTALDPSILHPISLAFLYEYREPTFGILYSQVATSSALLPERKDVVFYTVFTLDLEQQASTILLSVSRLPSDLFRVVALPPPVGGALLIGSNELVHIDQAGKTNAVGVNEFSRQVSSFSMTDQSDLALRLENCIVECLGDSSGDMLLVLSTGEMAIVKFKLDGRSVSGISVHLLPAHAGLTSMNSAAAASTFIGDGKIFLGSEDGDSVLLGYSCSSSSTKKHRLQAKQAIDDSADMSEEDQSEDDVYEDDLYSTSPDTTLTGRRPSGESSAFGLYDFRMHDKLINIGPLRDITMGRKLPTNQEKGGDRTNSTSPELQIVASQGSHKSGGLVVMAREIDPHVVASISLESVDSIWTASLTWEEEAVSRTSEKIGQRSQRCYVIATEAKASDREESLIFVVDGHDLKPFRAPDFNPNEDVTINIGTQESRKRVVQVLKNEVRSYDIDLGLTQIYPIWDDDTNDERMAVSASLADSCLAILRDDSTLLFLQADDSGDLDEVVLGEDVASGKWISCCLYSDKTGLFSSIDRTLSEPVKNDMFLFLLSHDSKLFVYRVRDQKLLSIIEGLDGLSPLLSSEPPKRSGTRENLIEAIVADLGETWSASPYLILRSETDDLIIYKPFVIPTGPTGEIHTLKFSKENNSVLPMISPDVDSAQPSGSDYRARPLRILPDISGLSAVFMPGASAGFVLRTSASAPHFLRLRGESPRCRTIRFCQLPPMTRFDYQWTLKKVHLGEQVDHLAYSTSSGMYVLGTCHATDFKLPEDDELHPEWRNEAISFFPSARGSFVKLVSPNTWSIIDSYSLGTDEYVMAIKNISLEISENTHERKDLIVVGTAFARGEDIPSRGCIYVFEVVQVVPDPDDPETDRKLKLIGKESVKGAVTALSEIGGQGFVLVAQGQKCMVRGLKEDGSLLPVAFMDMQCYVSVVKELKGTGMCILGDAVKGIWFAGYSEEPYKMSLFAKDLDYLEVSAAEFLPDGKRLFIVVADSDCNIHVLQYDPEDPKSSNGDKLLSRSRFHTGNFASTLTLLPRTMVSSEKMISNSDDMDIDNQSALHQVLMTTQNGSLGLITCMPEESYRRLSALQSQLTNTLEHPCGLNPRAFRAVESDGTAGRGMLDGNLLFKWIDMSKQRKTEIAGRVGAREWEIKADLEAISGDGLGYL